MTPVRSWTLAVVTLSLAWVCPSGCSSDDEGGGGGASGASGGQGGSGATGGSSSGGSPGDGGCNVTQSGCETCLTSKCANQVTQCDADTQCASARTSFVGCASTCQKTYAMCGAEFVTAGGSLAVDLWSCAKISCAGATSDQCGS